MFIYKIPRVHFGVDLWEDLLNVNVAAEFRPENRVLGYETHFLYLHLGNSPLSVKIIHHCIICRLVLRPRVNINL